MRRPETFRLNKFKNMSNVASAFITGHAITFKPYIGTDDVSMGLEGIETANRQPPSYGVKRVTKVIPVKNLGINVHVRNQASQLTGQAIRSFNPTAAREKRKEKM